MSTQPEIQHVTVEIFGQTYHLAGQSVDHIPALAARLDQMMRAVAGASRTPDTLRIAVLAALNLADELTQAEERLQKTEQANQRDQSHALQQREQVRERASTLANLLDSVLKEGHTTPGNQ